MTWLIIWLIVVAIVMLIMAVRISILEDKLETCVSEKRFTKLADTHNNFVDFVQDGFDNIYEQVNDRIDDINNEFHNVYDVLGASKEFADDVTDTMELMCDTDEMIINRINDIEEDLAVNDVILDDIISELFTEQPDEVEEKPAKKTKKTNKK